MRGGLTWRRVCQGSGGQPNSTPEYANGCLVHVRIRRRSRECRNGATTLRFPELAGSFRIVITVLDSPRHAVNPAPALRFASTAVLVALIAPLGTPQAQTDPEVRQLVSQEMRPRLPADGIGGFAVVIRSYGRNLFFNHGYADGAGKRPVDSDSLFNLASIGKVFDATLLAQMVQQRELDLDDPVVQYIPELQQGGHTTGPLPPHIYTLSLHDAHRAPFLHHHPARGH